MTNRHKKVIKRNHRKEKELKQQSKRNIIKNKNKSDKLFYEILKMYQDNKENSKNIHNRQEYVSNMPKYIVDDLLKKHNYKQRNDIDIIEVQEYYCHNREYIHYTFNLNPKLDTTNFKFYSDRFIITKLALNYLDDLGISIRDVLNEHFKGNWGSEYEEDIELMNHYLEQGNGVLESYLKPNHFNINDKELVKKIKNELNISSKIINVRTENDKSQTNIFMIQER